MNNSLAQTRKVNQNGSKTLEHFIKKKGWLDYLYYFVGRQQYDFFLQFSEKEGIKTKWKKYSEVCFDFENPKNKWFIENCNQRQILPVEVVLDLEEKDSLGGIIEELKSWNVIFYVWDTGSRGYHINLYFKRELNQKQKQAIIEYFGADVQKSYEKTLIALENSKHWKSGKLKTEVELDVN